MNLSHRSLPGPASATTLCWVAFVSLDLPLSCGLVGKDGLGVRKLGVCSMSPLQKQAELQLLYRGGGGLESGPSE